MATASKPSRLTASSMHFTPGARTAWHTHPNGQTIYVTEGVGRCHRRRGPIEIIRPGDRVYFEPGEHHWHGADPTRFMTRVAMQDVDDQGNQVTWASQAKRRARGWSMSGPQVRQRRKAAPRDGACRALPDIAEILGRCLLLADSHG